MRGAGWKWLYALVLLALFAGLSRTVHAHDSRPLSVHIKPTGPQSYSLSWKAPPSVAADNRPDVTLALPCQYQNGTPTGREKSTALYLCAQAAAPLELTITYPVFNPGLSTVIIYEAADGEQSFTTLAPDVRHWSPQIGAAAQGAGVVLWRYLEIGVVHIFKGLDHLLFLVLLVLMVASIRPLLWMITGFTLAHTLTLALSTFGILNLRIDIVEVLIALSIVFLAAEILRGNRDTLSWRKPVLITSLFGLVHGLGFASVLREIGFPEDQAWLSLAGFNIGVEIGQVIFVSAIWLFLMAVRKLFAGQTNLTLAHTLPLWAIGLMAGFWTTERITAVLLGVVG